MKYISLSIPGEIPTIIAFSPNLTHDAVAGAILRALPRAEVLGAGFLATPPEQPPRCVGESTSLHLGPANIDQAIVDAAIRITSRTYPYEPLLDGVTPR